MRWAFLFYFPGLSHGPVGHALACKRQSEPLLIEFGKVVRGHQERALGGTMSGRLKARCAGR